MVLTGLTLVGFGTAQMTWQNGDFRMKFIDCARTSSAEVACAFDTTYTGTAETSSALFNPRDVRIVLSGGREVQAQELGGGLRSLLPNAK